ncbi:MAG: hypothetical protein AAB498_02010 [Patescibacteria group bacterium]
MGIDMIPAETPEEGEKKKPPVNPKTGQPWENYGETEVDFEGGEVSVTNRKTGETTVNPDKEPFSFFNRIDRVDQDKVIAELEKFKNSKNIIGFSPSELIVKVDQKREELSKEILEARENKTD